MTAQKVVADDALGKIARKQWELFRRVKEGGLDPNSVLNTLQALIQNQVDRFDVEKPGLEISSKTYDVVVEEGDDFVSRVKELGFEWNFDNFETFFKGPFTVEGCKRRKKKSRLHLAQLTNHHTASDVDVVKIHTEQAGFDLASPWELLSFVRQSSVMQIIRTMSVIALSGYLRRSWIKTGLASYAHILVENHDRTWSFKNYFSEDSPCKLDSQRIEWLTYILLRERD